MIEFRDVAVYAPDATGGNTILHPFSLTLSEQRVSIIGANGSGKSTLARLVNGLVSPSSGSVHLSVDPGKPLHTVRDGRAVRRAVGFVFTNPDAQLIMPTVIEDVALSLRGSLQSYRHDKKARLAAAADVLTRFGLSDLAQRSVHELSGGQKQLVALAAVLATDPAVVVADEPTTLLDLRNSQQIADFLFALPQQLILVTHDLDLAVRADRTLVIDAGRIVFDGEPEAAVHFYRRLVSGA